MSGPTFHPLRLRLDKHLHARTAPIDLLGDVRFVPAPLVDTPLVRAT